MHFTRQLDSLYRFKIVNSFPSPPSNRKCAKIPSHRLTVEQWNEKIFGKNRKIYSKSIGDVKSPTDSCPARIIADASLRIASAQSCRRHSKYSSTTSMKRRSVRGTRCVARATVFRRQNGRRLRSACARASHTATMYSNRMQSSWFNECYPPRRK